MINKKRAFLKLLIIELEDLDDDINLLINEWERKSQTHESTVYVCKQNLAVLHNELFGIKDYIKVIHMNR